MKTSATVSGTIVLAGAVHYGRGWIKQAAGALMLGAYIGLLKFGTDSPELHMDDPSQPIWKLAAAGPMISTMRRDLRTSH